MSDAPVPSPSAPRPASAPFRPRSGTSFFVAIANVFLVGYGLDAGLSVLEEGLRAATGSGLLPGLRNAIAFGVLAVSAPVFLLTALSPQLPARLLVPLIAVLAWLGFGAAPIQLFVPLGHLALTGSVIQLVAIACGFVWVRTRSGSEGWLLAVRPDRAELSGWRALGFGAGSIGLGVPAVCGYLLLAGLTWLQVGTHGFLRFDVHGLSMGERFYEHDDRRVALIGMMHVGESEAYASLYDSFATPSTVVLQEGVTDREERLAQPLRYARVAEALGLTEQTPIERYFEEAWEGTDEEERWPHVLRADVDASAFSPETIAVLSQAARAWATSNVRELVEVWLEISRHPVDVGRLWNDIVVQRNQHLLAELDAALPEYRRVVIPWGALHLPSIEAALLARGFVPVGESSRQLISWSALASRLLGLAAEAPAPDRASEPSPR